MGVVTASLALKHLLRLRLFSIAVRLLAHLAEGLLVVILATLIAEREILRELKVVQRRCNCVKKLVGTWLKVELRVEKCLCVAELALKAFLALPLALGYCLHRWV
jgi:hypothetical protein